MSVAVSNASADMSLLRMWPTINARTHALRLNNTEDHDLWEIQPAFSDMDFCDEDCDEDYDGQDLVDVQSCLGRIETCKIAFGS